MCTYAHVYMSVCLLVCWFQPETINTRVYGSGGHEVYTWDILKQQLGREKKKLLVCRLKHECIALHVIF